MNIYPVNSKIPQWAIRKTLEGPLQPNDDSKHPDLVANKELVQAMKKTAGTQPKSDEQIAEDIEVMKIASPALKRLNTGSIKKASANSKNEAEVQEAINNSISGVHIDANTTLHSAKVLPSRGHVVESVPASRYASQLPGGLSMFGGTMSSNDTLMQQLSDLSRESNKERRTKEAAYNDRNRLTGQALAEQQKARKLGGNINEYTGMLMGTVTSTNQASFAEDSFTDPMKIFKNKIAKVDGKLDPESAKLAEKIKDYQLEKFRNNVEASKVSWREGAVRDIETRVTHASRRADELVAERDIRRNAEKFVPTVDDLKQALASKGPVQDTRKDNMVKSAQRVQAIQTERTQKEEIGLSQVVKPTNRIAEGMLKLMKTAGWEGFIVQRNKDGQTFYSGENGWVRHKWQARIFDKSKLESVKQKVDQDPTMQIIPIAENNREEFEALPMS